jgi:hypothetical protein
VTFPGHEWAGEDGERLVADSHVVAEIAEHAFDEDLLPSGLPRSAGTGTWAPASGSTGLDEIGPQRESRQIAVRGGRSTSTGR